MMTIDEAIRHCEEVAEKMNDCECAADHRQLAEWLKELNELKEIFSKVDIGAAKPKDYLDLLNEWAKMKELLKAAVKDIRHCMRSYDPCEVCALLEDNGECAAADDDDCEEKYKWRCEAEALALIGEEGEQNG